MLVALVDKKTMTAHEISDNVAALRIPWHKFMSFDARKYKDFYSFSIKDFLVLDIHTAYETAVDYLKKIIPEGKLYLAPREIDENVFVETVRAARDES